MEKNKSNLSVLLGAAFLMATSAIGPGFMTQTATFTTKIGADFAAVILISIIFSYIAQLNVWRVIAVSKMRGQDIANNVLPGLGYLIALLVAIGGLAFNIGNIGGAGLGLNVIFGIDVKIGAAIGGVIGIILFSSKQASSIMDRVTQVLGALMIILIAFVAVKTKPPVGEAVHTAVAPVGGFKSIVQPTLTLIGGTVGGYIIFSGGHRLIDAGITGEENLSQVNKSASLGMLVAFIVRVLLFLAILGVTKMANAQIDPDNIAASSFLAASGVVGYKIFGFVFAAAAFTSVVGAAYTSVSFLKTLFKFVEEHENMVTILFIVISTILFILIGKPQTLLVVVGTLNGFILPITLAVILVASQKKKIVGDYVHSKVLFVLGWIVVAVTAFMGVQTLITNIIK
ncbi:MAG: NRAMP family divalent metal transporter [Peptoniphilus lacydonensis]|jgi:ycsH protein|uniref:NRAMP family divalent metal transporter n=1 Tax=Peptoniphilus lacydonensis TaxID=1673725 RepID=UPI0008D997BE|nr:NRAMP family divalent metal transporter [Peptoniphilus lacydonensis]MDU2110384.1 NRAMP family divalent metal transporter [Peptoniphilus lacydonensis]MDU2115922.1 NRAMP family divalent metal transporter [Peptoniphilus lacydonensis]